MAKELPFFKFDISEWMFGRIQKQPLEVQGVFTNLCCKYWHKLGQYTYEDACFDFSKEHIDILVQSRIVKKETAKLSIVFLDQQLDELNEMAKKNSEKGRKSAQLRSTRVEPVSTTVQPQSTTVEPLLTSVEPQSTGVQPDSTEEKRREENILNTLCLVFGKQYKQPEDRMPTDFTFYKDVENAYDNLSKGMKPDEIGFQVECYLKYCQQKDQKVITTAHRLTETISRADWAVMIGINRERPPDPYSEAAYNLTLWTKQAWEERYKNQLTTDENFRKRFGYGELSKNSTVGLHTQGRKSA